MGTKNKPGQFDCYDKAEADEPIFVLRAKDRYAPDIVRQWADKFELGESIRNSDGRGPQPLEGTQKEKWEEAVKVANQMERWRWKNIK